MSHSSYFDKLNPSEKAKVTASVCEMGAAEPRLSGAKRYYVDSFETRKEEAARNLVQEREQATATTTPPSPSLSISNNFGVAGVYGGVVHAGSVQVPSSPATQVPEPELQDEEEQEPPSKRLKSIVKPTLKYDGGSGAAPVLATPRKLTFSSDIVNVEKTCLRSHVTSWDEQLKETTDLEVAKAIGHQSLAETRYYRNEIVSLARQDHTVERLRAERNNALDHHYKAAKECQKAFEERDKTMRQSNLEIAYLESENDRLRRELNDKRRIINCLRAKYDI